MHSRLLQYPSGEQNEHNFIRQIFFASPQCAHRITMQVPIQTSTSRSMIDTQFPRTHHLLPFNSFCRRTSTHLISFLFRTQIRSPFNFFPSPSQDANLLLISFHLDAQDKSFLSIIFLLQAQVLLISFLSHTTTSLFVLGFMESV